MQKLRSQSRLAIRKPASLPIPILLALICFLNFSLVCPAAIIKVPENYLAIQSAIDAASDGDEIIVSPGTYYENIHFGGKNIILRSTDPASQITVTSTIIDGNQAGPAVTFFGIESSHCVLSGFTITNGYFPTGGGILGNGTTATIQYNDITTNTATYGGGLSSCDGTIRENKIYGNSASFSGGGLYQCDGVIQNNIIRSNWADRVGGGLNMCNGIIQNNLISQNTSGAHSGGLLSCNGIILNNTISHNSASSFSGGLGFSSGMVVNCIIWANSAPIGSQLYESSTPIYSCIQDWTGGGRGNISSDPRFVAPANGDYHLQSDSPCIDAGNKYYLFGKCMADIDAECRLMGGAVDMGGDEYNSAQDSDGDLLADNNESLLGSDPHNPDSDGDGLQDGVEVLRGTNPSVPNVPTGISVPVDFASIQKALFLAFPSEIVTVSPGIYKENLCFLGKNLILQSTSPLDQQIANNTIIDGEGIFSVICFEGTENEVCIVKGLSIRYGSAQYGGGICGNGTHATIEYNIISDNEASRGGGLHGCSGIIRNNTIQRNSCFYGGGLYSCDGTIQNNIISNNSALAGGGLADCIGIIENNIIFGNRASAHADYGSTVVTYGGGLYSCGGTIRNNVISHNWVYGTANEYCVISSHGGGLASCYGTIQNNTISYNEAFESVFGFVYPIGSGGGLYNCGGTIGGNTISHNSASGGAGVDRCDATIENNIIYSNYAAAYGGGVSKCDGTIQNNTIVFNSAAGGSEAAYCEGTIRNCIIWENTNRHGGPQLYGSVTPSYCCIQNWTGSGTGNISADPQFVDAPSGDFHLQSTSPCIDAGGYIDDVSQDFEGDPRPWDGTSEPRGDGSDFDIGADEFIWRISYDFTTFEEQWTTGAAAVVFSEPECVFEPGRLKLVSQNNMNNFGFWVSPENAIPVTKGYLYRARFVVSTNVAQPELVPQIRLRVNSRNFQQADCLIIDSSGDGGASPTPEGTSYDLYFVPPANTDYCMLAFDLLNFNPYDAARAELALENVLVERFRLDTLDESTTITWTYDFETSQEFWFPGDGTYAFTDPEFFWDEGALHLRSATNTNTFGFWHSDGIDVIIEADRLYRGTFEVRTDEPDRSRVPQMRLRFNTANMQAARTLEISSSGDGANSPGTTNTTYDRLYFLPPPNCVGKGLIVSFDILNFSPDDAAEASLILDRAIIETLELPGLP